MKEIADYIAIKAISTEDLTKWVNMHIKDGWQPFGGISSCQCAVDEKGKPANFIVVSQAMVKYA